MALALADLGLQFVASTLELASWARMLIGPGRETTCFVYRHLVQAVTY